MPGLLHANNRDEEKTERDRDIIHLGIPHRGRTSQFGTDQAQPLLQMHQTHLTAPRGSAKDSGETSIAAMARHHWTLACDGTLLQES